MNARFEWIDNRDLRPCQQCKGPLGPAFIVREDRLAVVDPERATQHMGLTTMFALGGEQAAEQVANALGPGAVFKLDSQYRVKRFLCQKCANK